MLRWRPAATILVLAALGAACTSAGAPATTVPATTAPATTAPASAPPTASPVATASPTPIPTGPATLDAPAEVAAGAEFEVSWTGPNASGDYITLVKAGTDRWTNEPYIYATTDSPGTLTAPTTAGAYEVWYVDGADSTVKARRPVTVAAFVGTLTGPAEVVAGSDFEVSWTGPNGPGDYVTIVAAGATRWTNEDYFYTSTGPTGELTAPIATGAHEIWYVAGQDTAPLIRRPVTITEASFTLDAPATVQAGASFEVEWTGPDGPSDYITIVPAGSPDGTYLSYAYTAGGSPVTLTAPTEAGDYEIRYASDRVDGVFARRPIVVE